LQARTGTLIGGTSALQYLERRPHESGTPLKLFVHSCHRREVGRWLVRAGYSFVPAPYQDPDFEIEISRTINLPPGGMQILEGISTYVSFRKVSTLEGGFLQVEVTVAENTPMEIILSSYSTCLMNAISFDAAYCLFPRATLEARTTLVTTAPSGLPKRYRQGIEEHLSSGHTLVVHIPEHEFYSSSCPYPLGWRWVDDSCSWVLRFSVGGINPPTKSSGALLRRDPMTISNWLMRYVPIRGASIHFAIVRCDSLKYKYIAADVDLTSFLARKLA
ncbi:hypothetical protein C8T65DRAFT_523508, partial [Cerioporus squamosus]